MSSKHAASRRRGAQPGNLNALRHGLYSRRLSESDNHALNAVSPLDLTPEIEMLRHYGQELLIAAQDPRQLSDSLQVVRSLALVASMINRLTRTQSILSRLAASSPQNPPSALPDQKRPA